MENTNTQQNYKQYDTQSPNNVMILAQQNAGNIEYLKQRIDTIQGIFEQVKGLSNDVKQLQTQMDGLLQTQQDYANQMTGGTAPEISGLNDNDDVENTDSKNNDKQM